MTNDWEIGLKIYGFAVSISIIWFAIHYYLRRKEKLGKALTPKEFEWKSASLFAGFLFLIFPPILMFLLLQFGDFSLIGLILLIGAPGALISIIRKGKL